MSNVILSQSDLEALRNVIRYAQELVTAIPYITAAGGNVTRQNIAVQALATALEGARVVDFENVRELEGVKHAAIDNRRTRKSTR